jgi:hypothetical protein
VNRAELQQLAEARILDAEALLDASRWSAAYYLTGYAVECGLKACVLAHIEKTGIIFKDRKYLRNLANCWTHDLSVLVDLAGLKQEFGEARGVSSALDANWDITSN